MIDEFQRRTGIEVRYDLYDSNEPVLEKLQSGVADYDLVVPSDYMVRILVHLKLLRPLDKSRLEEPRKPRPPVSRQGVRPGQRLLAAVPLGDDRLRLQPAEGGRAEHDSWAPLFDPANRGQILMLDDMRECFAVALKFLGHSLNSTDPAVLKQAADLLKKQKPLVKTYNSGDYENILAVRRRRPTPTATTASSPSSSPGSRRGSPTCCRRKARRSGWTASASPRRARNVELRSTPSSTTCWSPRSTRGSSTASATPARTSRRGASSGPRSWTTPRSILREDALARCEFVEDIGEATDDARRVLDRDQGAVIWDFGLRKEPHLMKSYKNFVNGRMVKPRSRAARRRSSAR